VFLFDMIFSKLTATGIMLWSKAGIAVRPENRVNRMGRVRSPSKGGCGRRHATIDLGAIRENCKRPSAGRRRALRRRGQG
jgi:hypothetical protein